VILLLYHLLPISSHITIPIQYMPRQISTPLASFYTSVAN
jgi:hypothetical protein